MVRNTLNINPEIKEVKFMENYINDSLQIQLEIIN